MKPRIDQMDIEGKELNNLLILSRKAREKVVITMPNGDDLFIAIVSLDNHVVRIGFEANDEYVIDREEIYLSKRREQ